MQQVGWKVEISAERKPQRGGKEGGSDEQRAEEVLPPDLAKGQPQDVIEIKAVKKSTRPPKRFTEGTLLTAMETAGEPWKRGNSRKP